MNYLIVNYELCNIRNEYYLVNLREYQNTTDKNQVMNSTI
jgi:hypothetical protein